MASMGEFQEEKPLLTKKQQCISASGSGLFVITDGTVKSALSVKGNFFSHLEPGRFNYLFLFYKWNYHLLTAL